MRAIVILFFLHFVHVNVQGPLYDWYDINFDQPEKFYRITIDTVSNPNNIWQIGPPQKSVFDSASSDPNVIVTDTVNSYPVNDTSSFTITHIAGEGFSLPHTVELQGEYKVDSDTLSDFGLIEFSPNNGQDWLDLINDGDSLGVEWWGEKPNLTGYSGQWVSFHVGFFDLLFGFNIELGDTLLYRFTFISDSIQTNRDGLMFDNLHFEDWAEGIEDQLIQDFTSIAFPNPASSLVTIEFDNLESEPHQLVIFNSNGQKIFENTLSNESVIHLDLDSFPNGMFYYRLINLEDKKTSWGKIVK